MQVAVSDCAQIDQLLPIVLRYNVGIEIQELATRQFLTRPPDKG
jgi:hypothetical protein